MYEILCWNTALTEGVSNVGDIINYIKGFLNKENTIAVLQQIPFKDPNNNWEHHDIYNRFFECFPVKEYKIEKNTSYNNGSIVMMTVIITKLQNVSSAHIDVYPNGLATNRESAIQVFDNDNKNKFTILGLHAQKGKDNVTYLKNINGNADIILGDFNAGDYQECENWKIFRNIISSHVCICNIPTKRVLSKTGDLIRKTCIDHVFVRRELVTRCSNVVVHEDIGYSDHYPITFTYNKINDNKKLFYPQKR